MDDLLRFLPIEKAVHFGNTWRRPLVPWVRFLVRSGAARGFSWLGMCGERLLFPTSDVAYLCLE